MRFGRLSWGIVAGAVAVAAVFVVQVLETRFLGSSNRGSLWAAFVGAGGAVLWLADRFELIESPYAQSPFGIRGEAARLEATAGVEGPAWKEPFDRGMSIGDAGDIRGALPHFRQAARLAPDEPYPHYELGYTLFLIGEVEPALAAFRRTNELLEGFFLVQTEIYMCEAVLAGVLDTESIAILRRIQNLTDTGEGQNQEAASLSRALIGRAPTCALGHYYLGKALVSEDGAQSEGALRRCLELNPDDTVAIDALTHIGAHRSQAGDPEAARAIWLDVVTKYRSNPHVKPTEALFLQT